MPKQNRDRDKIAKDAPIWAKRINQCLIDKDMTQEELAKKSGVSKATITAWIKGDKNGRVTEPKVQGIIDISRAMNVSTDYLLGISETKYPRVSVRGTMEYTGLEEKAVQSIMRCRDDEKKALNAFLGSSQAVELFNQTAFLMYFYQTRIEDKKHFEENLNHLLKFAKKTPHDEERKNWGNLDRIGYYRYLCARRFESVLDEIVENSKGG